MFYNKKIFKRCFCYTPKYWYLNIKEIPLYFKLMHHLIKYGYDSYAHINTFDWFIDVMKDILSNFREHHNGYPVISLNDKEKQEKYEKEYDADIDTLISLLEDMDEDNPKYEADEYKDDGWKKQHEEMELAKNEFFQLFSKLFWSLWD